MLPGTAIGIRNDYIWSAGYWTIYGFYVNQGGSITSHGTPTKPNIFTAADLVQEKPNINFAEYQIDYSEYAGDWLPGIVSFVTDFEPGDPTSPTLDFRFSHFYVPAADIHFCSGLSYDDFWFFSASSSVNLNLQDCSLHNGQVNLGQPDDYDFAQDQIFGSGAVTWNNTMFENVTINLDPTFHELGVDDQGLNVDLSFQACNNLFRGGQWMHLEPVVSTSAGNWVLQDNLFDQVNFIQDINQPLDFDYNGYWPLTADSVAWDAYLDPWAVPNTNYLQTTITLDGFTDGNNEQYLSTAPPYQCGPFGHYYMPTNTILYQAGSRTADAAGFCQYSTRVDQTKENIGETVDIGLHYVAAGNSPSGWVPLDTDGDGIPDYVEDRLGNGATGSNAVALGETDWTTAHTIPGVWDPTNSVYNNVDSSGDGLVGQAKKALEMQPLDTSNPLTLVQQPNGPDSNIVTFIAPANFAGVSSVGCLSLLVDGRPASFVACESGPNGGCLLSWDITYAVPGQHYIQSQFSLYGQPISGGWGVLGVASINPGTPPYPYPLIPGTAQWNNSSVADRLASLNLPQSWTNTATSWQLFSTAIATPYFRTIVVLGVSITDSYTAAKLGTASILNTVEASPDFGANTLYFLESLDVTAVDSVPCSQSSQPCCWMDYIIVCHMASLDTCLNTMNEESIQELFGLAAWDANYFILIGDTTVATAPVSLMYAIYNMPESSRGSLPPNVALPTLTAQESTDMDQGTLDTELTSPISSVVSELGLTNRP